VISFQTMLEFLVNSDYVFK